VAVLQDSGYGECGTGRKWGMNCPKCQGKTKVRKVFDKIRLRVCTFCGFKFQTEEVILKELK
jgi:Zn ribbon nucleic-acid-binding protein